MDKAARPVFRARERRPHICLTRRSAQPCGAAQQPVRCPLPPRKQRVQNVSRRHFQLRDFEKALNADVMKKSSGNPPWIKDYCGQLEDPEYLQLTLSERGLLKDLRLLAARRGNRLPDDEKVLVMQLRYPTRTRLAPKLSKLRALRFTEAYKPAATPPANGHKTSRDVLEDGATLSSTEERRSTPLPPYGENLKCPHCRPDRKPFPNTEELQGHLEDVHGRFPHPQPKAAA